MTATHTTPALTPAGSPRWNIGHDHSDWCDCRQSGFTLMRWQPGDGTYRPADYDTPPHQPRGRR